MENSYSGIGQIMNLVRKVRSLGRRGAALLQDTLQRQGVRKAANNTGWLSVERGLRLILGVTVGAWVARYLQPESYGVLAFALSVVALAQPIAMMGLDRVLVKEVLTRPDERDEILLGAMLLKLIGGWLAFSVVVMFAVFGPDDVAVRTLTIVVATTLLFQPLEAARLLLESQLRARFTTTVRASVAVLAAAANVVLILGNAPLIGFAWVSVAEYSLGLLVLSMPLLARLSTQRSAPRLGIVVGLWKESWPLIISGLAVLIYMKIDIVMLQVLRGSQETGIYYAATRLSDVWYFVPTAVIASVTPAILDARREGSASYMMRLGLLLELLTVLALLIACMTTILAPLMIRTLFGTAFAQAAPILAVHIWAGVFVFSGVAQEAYAVNEQLNTLTMIKTLIGAMLNIALNIALIPHLAGLGAAIATLISYAVALMAANALFKEMRPVFVIQVRSFTLPRLRRLLTSGRHFGA